MSSELAPPTADREGPGGGGSGRWKEVWRCKVALPVVHLKFSPDGAMFASASEVGRLCHLTLILLQEITYRKVWLCVIEHTLLLVV